VVGSPAYFDSRTRPKTPGDLVAHECIRGRLPSGAMLKWEFEKRGEQMVVDVKGPLTLDHYELWIDAALEGAGLAYVNEWSVSHEISSGRLIRVLEDWNQPFPGLSLYYPGHRHVPAGLRAFIGIIRETASRR
jgi:DNA-binding transcriptional LysR family regulator